MARPAIVIGAGAERGPGAAICRRFAREGLPVFPLGRTASRVEALAAAIPARCGSATTVVADATSATDVTRLFDSVSAQAGVPQLVVYNAGNNRFSALLEMDDAYWFLQAQHRSAWTLEFDLRPFKESF